jgi:hypothetical protein
VRSRRDSTIARGALSGEPGVERRLRVNGAWRSALAADTAQQIGLAPDLDAGFTAWKNAGYPVAERVKKNPG